MQAPHEQDDPSRRCTSIPKWTYPVAVALTVLALVLTAACGILGALAIGVFIHEGTYAAILFAIVAMLMLAGAIGLNLLHVWLIDENRWREHRLQRNKCPNCLYDIRHLLSGRCPECGEWIESDDKGGE